MRKRSRSHQLSLCLGGIALTALARQAQAQLAVTGNLGSTPVNYGSNVPGTGALTTQTIGTGFGTSTYAGNQDNTGSELDAAYGVVQNGSLYLFLAGDLQNGGNHLNVFIDDGASGGQSTFQATPGGLFAASAMNGSKFSPGFTANMMLDINEYNGSMYADQYVLNGSGSTNNYLGSIPLTNDIGTGNLSGITVGFNDSNVDSPTSGNDGNQGAAENTGNLQAVTKGVEIGIPLADLGTPSGNILVLAAINGGNDGYLSNQFLPGLPVGTNNLATATFDFSSTPGEYFSVASSLPNGTWINPGSGTWGTSTNWVNNNSPSPAYVPHLAGDSATFSVANANSTVTLDASYSVGNLSFSSSFSYTIAPQSATVGVLTMDNGSSAASITDFNGTHTISAPVVLNSNTTVTVVNNGNSVLISGNISGNGGLTANSSGNGTVVLSGTNIYSGGTTVSAGNLQLASAGALPTGTALTLSALDVPAGTLDLDGNNATVSSITVLTGPQTIPTGAVAQIINTGVGVSTFTYAGSNGNPSTFDGNISDPAIHGVAVTVASGSLTLSGNNTYTGGTTINSGGHLIASYNFGGSMVGITNALPASGNVVNNGTLEISNAYVTNPATILAATLGNVSGSGTTTVDANMSVDVASFSQAGLVNNGSTEIDGNGTVGTSSGGGAITGGGALTIGNGSTSNTLQLAHNSGGSSQGSVTIAGNSVLDIGNNHMFINYGSGSDPITTIAAYIKTGYNGGGWNGPGIISSEALTNPSGLLYGVGYADGADGVVSTLTAGQVEVMYTLLGDANLDSFVNTSDFNIVAANFNQQITGWDQGDFNYDGFVNTADFNALAANFNQGDSGAASAGDIAALDAFAAANGLSLPTSSVPEPASAAMTVMAGLGILRRRRRR